MYIREKDTERSTSGVTVDIDATECSEQSELFTENVEEVVEGIEEKIVPEKERVSR